MQTPPTLDEQISVIDHEIAAFRRAFTHTSGEHKYTIPEPEIIRDLECYEAIRRVLVWAKHHPSFATMGIHLTQPQRAELKGLEAATLHGDAAPATNQALLEREREWSVYDDLAPSPRWQ